MLFLSLKAVKVVRDFDCKVTQEANNYMHGKLPERSIKLIIVEGCDFWFDHFFKKKPSPCM
jgi:hypothetical protein